MDVFYEESCSPKNSKKEMRRYKILHVISRIFLLLSCILLVLTVLYIPSPMALFLGLPTVMFVSIWFILQKWKYRYNVSYDYVFVSGELRISKVFNLYRRRLFVRIDCQDMIQIGDVDNPSFERFYADPNTKTVLCTTNDKPAEGKFFMYVLANVGVKKLFVLECRENLLMNILKFAKRSTLESDYVMQERKQK